MVDLCIPKENTFTVSILGFRRAWIFERDSSTFYQHDLQPICRKKVLFIDVCFIIQTQSQQRMIKFPPRITMRMPIKLQNRTYRY